MVIMVHDTQGLDFAVWRHMLIAFFFFSILLTTPSTSSFLPPSFSGGHQDFEQEQNQAIGHGGESPSRD